MAIDTLGYEAARAMRSRGFTGELITAEDAAYEEARKVWSGSIDRRPAAVARCLDDDDVAAAVTAADALEVPLAVRAGAHSAPGHSTCDDGIVIDLCRMRQVAVDPQRRRARVAGGALLGDLDGATQKHGLAVPAGHVSHTGVGGLTLGGGVGHLMRKHGLTIDSLLSARVVTAAGETVRASHEENAGLFWALRGGGGNFGVVTEFEFELHEVGPIITAGALVFPHERAPEVLRASRELMSHAPDDLTINEIQITLPDHPPFPPELQGTEVVMLIVAHVGEEEEARADIAPLRELGPTLDIVDRMPYLALQTMIDYDTRHGLGHYSKAHWLGGFEDGVIDAITEAFEPPPTAGCQIITARLGGAIDRVAPEATAFSHRGAGNQLWVIALWDDPSDPGVACREWVNRVMGAADPYASGAVYVNALGEGEHDRVHEAYGAANYERLRQAKRRWDPDNLFRLNANIPPA